MSASLYHYKSQTKAREEKSGDVMVKMVVFKFRFGNDLTGNGAWVVCYQDPELLVHHHQRRRVHPQYIAR